MKRAARPVTFSLAIILLVYMPLLALEGVEGRMFRPMAITVGLALGGALAFSLTAFPALAAFVVRAPAAALTTGSTASWARLEQPIPATARAVPRASATDARRLRLLLLAGAGRCSGRAWARSSFRVWTKVSCLSTSSGSRRCRSRRPSVWATRSRTFSAAFPRCSRSSPAPAARRSRPIPSDPTRPRSWSSFAPRRNG